MILLQGMLSESTPHQVWEAAALAESWRPIRSKLSTLADSLTDEAGDTLESFCFVLDEVVSEGSRDRCRIAIREIEAAMAESVLDTGVQILIQSELLRLSERL